MLKSLTRSLTQFSPAFGDVSHLEHYRPAYKQKNLADRAYLNRIGCLISIVIVTLGIPLDYVVYPEQFVQFAFLRVAEVAFLMAMYCITTLPSVKPYLFLVTTAFTSSVILTVVIIIYQTDGATSTYYAGINLVLLGIGFMLGLSFKEALFYTCLTLASYLAVSAASGIPDGAWRIVINNSYFIFLTGVVANIAAYFSERERFYTFCQEQEIQRKNSELKEMDRLKTEFLANVSHELRTPLTVIVGPAKHLLENEGNQLSEHSREVIERIVRNGSRLIKLVNDVLEVMSFESGKKHAKLSPIAFDRVVKSTADQLSALFHSQSGRKLQVNIGDEVIPVMGSEMQLERVCFNLIQNAYKFSPAKNGEVSVSLVRQGSKAVLTVKDNGIGIDPKDHKVIFERYRQADGSQTRRYHGTGIGLALVREIVSAHGGSIDVSSKPNFGATFTVSFPITNQVIDETFSTEDERVDLFRSAEVDCLNSFEQRSAVSAGNKPLCLVVDDEPDMAAYIRTVLASEFEVQIAVDAYEGQKLFEQTRPSCVISDQMLPGMSGAEFVAWCRRQPNGQTVPIIMLTAKNDPLTKQAAIDAGSDAFLGKPFDAIALRKSLADLMKSSDRGVIARPKLVIVDDEDDIAAVLVDLFQSSYDIIRVADGGSAVETIRECQPSAVLLDHMLPDKDGIHILTELKASKELRSIPVILLTANTKSNVKEQALKLGVDDFLSKPFSGPELTTRVFNLVQRTRLERLLESKNSELEKAICELKASEAQLIHSERWRTLNHFAGALIHEIGNPLNYALSAARVAASHSDDAVRVEALADATEGLQRIQLMVRELRDFLAPTATPSLELRPISLVEVIARAAKLNADRMSQVTLSVRDVEVEVVASDSALMHVLGNLIDNALYAILEKPVADPRIDIQGAIDEEGRFVTLSVSDNGPGVPAHLGSQIFEPFIHSNKSSGLGLGLSICKTLIDKMGGLIVLEPTDHGATFKITLPLAHQSQPSPLLTALPETI
ncbi:ATP-binding protein [Marinobacter guineae]|nr:ATP-binding protein [Marinobacter guineae]